MFPGPHAQVYYNEAGEPLGWDYPSEYEPDWEEQEREYYRTHCEDCGERFVPYEPHDCPEDLEDE